MKKHIIISVLSLLFIVSFTGCNEKDTNSVKNIDNSSVISKNTENLSSETTENSTITEISETTLNSETLLSESISETTPLPETSLSETPVQTSENTVNTVQISENSVTVSDVQTTETLTDNIITEYFHNSTDKLISNNIEVSYNNSELTEECISQITEYLLSMQNCDAETYEKMLVPVYKDHLNKYLSQENYTIQTLLDKNKENISEITGGDFTYSKIELQVLSDEDFQNSPTIPDYATSYKKQLDELSFEKDGSYVSETFTECYSVLFNAYALSNQTEYCIFNKSVLVIFKTENQYYVMMS